MIIINLFHANPTPEGRNNLELLHKVYNELVRRHRAVGFDPVKLSAYLEENGLRYLGDDRYDIDDGLLTLARIKYTK